MSSTTSSAGASAAKLASVPIPRNIVAGGANADTRIPSHDYPPGDEDGDDVFSNPDTAELETRSDATGATSPAPNSPGPGSPTNRTTGHPITVVAPSGLDHFATLKQHDIVSATHASNVNSAGVVSHTGGFGLHAGKPLTLGSLPQTNVETLQKDFENQVSLDTTPQPTDTVGQLPASSTGKTGPTKASVIVTPTKGSSRPAYGRALSASGATMQTMSSPMHPTSSVSGASSRFGPSTPRLGGHASSLSASHFSLPHNHLPSAHGLPNDPREVSTVSKLFAHPPAQSPAEELQGFSFGGDGFNRRASAAVMGHSPGGVPGSISSPSASGTAHKHLSRPTTRPPSPDRYVSPSRKTNKRASLGAATGLGLSPRVGTNAMEDGAMIHGSHSSELSIFERDIEHRDASHVLSKQEAMDVAIPSVLDDAVEAIQGDSADQVEIVAPHAAPAPLALSMQALSAHSNGQVQVNQSSNADADAALGSNAPVSQRSAASSPHLSPSPPLSSVGAAIERPVGSMAAQIAERLAAAHAKTQATTTAQQPQDGVEGAAQTTSSRHRRPNSDVSNMSSSSSMRSRSPQAPLAVGVQQVMAASAASPRSITGAQSVTASRTDAQTMSAGSTSAASPTFATMRSTLPTATALPALPLPNPFRSQSPSASFATLPEVGSSMLPSVSMDGAVMPSNESATLNASLGTFADVIASQPPTSANSLANSPSMRMRGLGLEEPIQDASPYSSRSPVLTVAQSGSGGASSASQPVSPVAGRSSKSPSIIRQEEYAPPSVISGKKRLSFFSYADIINQTPAEVINFDEAVRQAELATLQKSVAGVSIIPASPTPTQSTSTMK